MSPLPCFAPGSVDTKNLIIDEYHMQFFSSLLPENAGSMLGFFRDFLDLPSH